MDGDERGVRIRVRGEGTGEEGEGAGRAGVEEWREGE